MTTENQSQAVVAPSSGPDYPVDPTKISTQFTEEELLYEVNKEEKVSEGIINPRFIRYHEEDPNNPAPRTDTQQMVYDYSSCQMCSRFNKKTGNCDELNKYIPIYVQLQGATCPLNKWE